MPKWARAQWANGPNGPKWARANGPCNGPMGPGTGQWAQMDPGTALNIWVIYIYMKNIYMK